MSQTFGDDDIACLKSRQEQQAQSALAPLTAQLVADAMLDNRIDPALEATSPRRFGKL